MVYLCLLLVTSWLWLAGATRSNCDFFLLKFVMTDNIEPNELAKWQHLLRGIPNWKIVTQYHASNIVKKKIKKIKKKQLQINPIRKISKKKKNHQNLSLLSQKIISSHKKFKDSDRHRLTLNLSNMFFTSAATKRRIRFVIVIPSSGFWL